MSADADVRKVRERLDKAHAELTAASEAARALPKEQRASIADAVAANNAAREAVGRLL